MLIAHTTKWEKSYFYYSSIFFDILLILSSLWQQAATTSEKINCKMDLLVDHQLEKVLNTCIRTGIYNRIIDLMIAIFLPYIVTWLFRTYGYFLSKIIFSSFGYRSTLPNFAAQGIGLTSSRLGNAGRSGGLVHSHMSGFSASAGNPVTANLATLRRSSPNSSSQYSQWRIQKDMGGKCSWKFVAIFFVLLSVILMSALIYTTGNAIFHTRLYRFLGMHVWRTVMNRASELSLKTIYIIYKKPLYRSATKKNISSCYQFLCKLWLITVKINFHFVICWAWYIQIP